MNNEMEFDIRKPKWNIGNFLIKIILFAICLPGLIIMAITLALCYEFLRTME